MQVVKYLTDVMDEAKRLARQHGYFLNIDREDVVIARSERSGVLLVLKTGLAIYVYRERVAGLLPVDFYVAGCGE